MLALKVIAALTFSCLAGAVSDLQQALWLVNCSKLAMKSGVPEANIPSHEPLHFPKNLNVNGSLGPLLRYVLKVDNIEWAGLSDFKIEASQLSADGDTIAIFNFTIYWPKFVLSLDFYGELSNIFYKREGQGNFSIVINHNFWNGQIAVKKPTAGHRAEFLDLEMLWTAETVEGNSNGLGIIGDLIVEEAVAVVNLAFLTHSGKEEIQDLLLRRLDKVWATDAPRVNKLISWCRKQGL